MVDAQNYTCFTIVATDLNELMQNLQQNETLPRPQHESDVPVACCSHICRRGRMHAGLTRCPWLCSHAYHMQAGLNLLMLLPVCWTRCPVGIISARRRLSADLTGLPRSLWGRAPSWALSAPWPETAQRDFPAPGSLQGYYLVITSTYNDDRPRVGCRLGLVSWRLWQR